MPASVFGRTLPNSFTNRTRSSTSAQTRSDLRSARAEKSQQAEEDFFKFKDPGSTSNNPSLSKKEKKSIKEKEKTLARISTNNHVNSSSSIPTLITPDGRMAAAAGMNVGNGSNESSGPSPARKGSVDSFGSAGLGVMNLDKLTGEQKAVGALVNKLLVKLPLSSGKSLGTLEMDPIVQETVRGLEKLAETRLSVVAHALTGVLDGLAKQTWNVSSASLPVNTLETELFILRTLSSCMDAYWRHHHHRSARTRNTSEPIDPDENRYHKPWPNPPSIEEPLAKFILSTMVLLLRMTTYEVSNSVASIAGYTGPPAGTFMTKGQTNHPSLGRSLIRQLHAGLEGEDIGFRYRQPQDLQTNGSVSTSGANADFGSSLAGSGAASRPGHRRNASLESTAIGVVGIPRVSSLLFEIARMVGRIVYFLSSSSWPVVFARIRNRILYLSSAPEEHPDAIELRLLDWCSVNQAKLTAIFREFATHFMHMKRSAQPAAAHAIESIIMNWVQSHPLEFVQLLRSGKRIEGGADALFDQVHSLATLPENVKGLRAFRPAKMALLIVCPDILLKCLQGEATGSGSTKKTIYLEVLRKNLRSNVVEDAVIQAYIDACRAGAVVPLSMTGTGLQELVGDIMRELKDALFGDAQTSEQRDSNLLIDGFCSLYLVKPPFCINAVPSLITDTSTMKVRTMLATSCWILETEVNMHPQRKSTQQLREMVAPTLRRWLKSSIKSVLSAQGITDNSLFRGYTGRPESQTVQEATNFLQSVFALYAVEPAWAFEKASPAPRLGRSGSGNPQTELLFDHRFGIDVNEDSLPALLAAMSSLAPKAVCDGQRDGLASAIRSIQTHLMALDYNSAVNIGLKRTLNRMNAVLLRDTALRCIDHLIAQPTKSGLSTAVSDLTAQIELSLRTAKEMVSVSGVSANLSELFMALMLADIVTISYLVSSEHEEVERTLRFLVTVTAIRREVFTGVEQHTGIMDQDTARWFMFMTSFSEDVKSERLSEEARSEQHSRIRVLLRRHATHCVASQTLWDLQYCRFERLSASIIQGTSPTGIQSSNDNLSRHAVTPSNTLFQNLTLFLAAFDGGSSSTDVNKSRSNSELSGLLRKWEGSLSAASLPLFFETITDLTVADSPVIRYTSVQVGSEVAIPHLRLLILQLSNLMQHSINNGIVERNEAFDMFVDNCTSILKNIQERTVEDGTEALKQTPELSRLVYMLAHYADEMSGAIAERCRARIASQLAEAADCSSLNNNLKGSLLLILESWLEARAQIGERSHRTPNASFSRGKAGEELDDTPHLKALAKLSEGCTFDTESIDDSHMTPVQLFASHMDFFGRYATRVSEASGIKGGAQHGWTKRIITNLMVNNADFAIRVVSPKLLLPEADVRTLYIAGAVEVLKHSNVDLVLNPEVKEDETKPFTKLLLQRDLRLVKALIQICSVNDSDVLAMAILRSWEREGSLLLLIKGMLIEEIRMTDSQAQLFRTNSVTTRIVAYYLRTVGFNYLRALLTPLIERMKHTEPDNSPSKIAELSQLILDDLTRTMDVPGPVRQVLGLVSAATMTKFPEARSQAVASFLVLRVLCPAIISPERLDLQISADHRRTLVQISKVIINVANNQYFAAKEMQLLSLNDFIGKNVGSIAQAMTELGSHAPLSGSPSGFDEDVHVTRSTDPLAIEADEAYLRYYITKKDSRVALAKNPTVENFIPLIELLRRTPAGTVNSAMDRTESYNDLLRRRGVKHAKATSWFYEGTPSSTGSRVFYFIAGEEDIIYDEAFLKHIFRSLSDVTSWDLIIDLTGFQDQPLASFAARLFAVFPVALLQGLRTIALYQPNFATLPNLRSIFILMTCSGLEFGTKVVAVASPSQLMTHIPYTNLDLPSISLAVSEIPAQHVYYDVFYEIEDARQIPILGYYKDGLVVLQSRVKQELLEGMSAELTEVFPIEEVGDQILSKISGPGASPLLRVIKEAKKSQMKATRTRRRFKAQETQRLTTSVVVLCAALFSLLSSDDIQCRMEASSLLRSANECFAFGLSSRSLRMEDPPIDHVLRIGTELAKYLPHMNVEMAEELIRLLSYVPAECRTTFVTLTSAWLGASISKTMVDGEMHAERLKMARNLTRSMVDLMSANSDDFSWVDPLFKQLGDESHPEVQEIVLETLIAQAIEMSRNYQAIGRIARALDICNADGLTIRLATTLRKEIASTCLQPSSTLPTHISWKKITCLVELLRIRLVKPLTLADVAAAMPDIAYSLLMMVGSGSPEVRSSVQGALSATIRAAIAMSQHDPEDRLRKPEAFLARFQGLSLFQTSEDNKRRNETHSEMLTSFQAYWSAAMEALTWAAPNNDTLNQWMSRLSGLLSASCFQRNDAVQHRALVAFGVFSISAVSGEIEDDLLYQLIVAAQNAVAASDSENIVVSLARCLSLMVKGVSRDSRYANGSGSLWWLGVTLLQTSKQSYRVSALELCQAVLDQANVHNPQDQQRIFEMLLEKRTQIYANLDSATGVNFDTETNWGFSTAALLFPGLKEQSSKAQTHQLFKDLLRLTMTDQASSPLVAGAALPIYAVLYTVAPSESARRTLWQETLNIHPSQASNMPSLLSMLEIPDNSTAVLLVTFLFAMLKAAGKSDDERILLTETLADAANQLPEVVLMMFAHWQSLLLSLLVTENPRILRAVTSVLALGSLRREMYSDGTRTPSRLSVDTTSDGGVEALRDMGMISVENLSLSSASSEKTIVLRGLAAQAIGQLTTDQGW